MKPFNTALTEALKYGKLDHTKVRQILLDKIQKEPDNKLPRQLFADYLEAHEKHQDPHTIERLREGDGSMWIHQDDEGKVRAGNILTPDKLKEYMDTKPLGQLDYEHKPTVFNGPGGSWFNAKLKTGKNLSVQWSHKLNKPLWETRITQFTPEHALEGAKAYSQSLLSDTEHN